VLSGRAATNLEKGVWPERAATDCAGDLVLLLPVGLYEKFCATKAGFRDEVHYRHPTLGRRRKRGGVDLSLQFEPDDAGGVL